MEQRSAYDSPGVSCTQYVRGSCAFVHGMRRLRFVPLTLTRPSGTRRTPRRFDQLSQSAMPLATRDASARFNWHCRYFLERPWPSTLVTSAEDTSTVPQCLSLLHASYTVHTLSTAAYPPTHTPLTLLLLATQRQPRLLHVCFDAFCPFSSLACHGAKAGQKNARRLSRKECLIAALERSC